MTTKQLTVTRDGEELPFAEMENTSETRMKLAMHGKTADGEQKCIILNLSKEEAQDFAKALDTFSFNYLED